VPSLQGGGRTENTIKTVCGGNWCFLSRADGGCRFLVSADRFVFAIFGRLFQATPMTQPLALVLYEKLLPGSQLVNRLQDAGYRVQTVPAAEALIACAEEEKPMIVLADLASTHANIAEIIGRLRQHGATSHIPVIAFADEKETDLQTAARDAGATLVVNDVAILTHLQQFLEQALRVD
jgi:CheY-like chemotaxis protein